MNFSSNPSNNAGDADHLAVLEDGFHCQADVEAHDDDQDGHEESPPSELSWLVQQQVKPALAIEESQPIAGLMATRSGMCGCIASALGKISDAWSCLCVDIKLSGLSDFKGVRWLISCDDFERLL